MNKWAELFTGLVIVVGMILLAWASSAYSWTLFGKDLNLLNAAWVFFKGGLFWLVFMIGILFILLGISDIKG
ncbi:MAG: hypothetical protein AABX84_00910 [Nanoarchaeota archaeon]